MIKESDWKTSKKVKAQALDTFYANAMAKLTEIINNNDLSNREKYFELYDKLAEIDKRLNSLFEDHSRSTAEFQCLLLRAQGLIDEQQLKEFSEEFRKSSNPRPY